MDSEDNKNLPQNNKGQGNKNSSNRDSNYNRNDNRGWKRDNKIIRIKCHTKIRISLLKILI